MDKITVLKGPDRVRKRPAVIFSSDDIHGAENAVRPILELYAMEAQLGHCKNLTVTHNGAEITIAGDDRGICLGDGSDDAVWKSIFCDLFAGPRSMGDQASYTFSFPDSSHSALFGEADASRSSCLPDPLGFMDLCAAQCACAYMDVSVVRDGLKHTLHFKKGHNEGGMHTERTTAHPGTSFHFALDPEVFTDTVLSVRFFTDALANYAMLSPGLICTYHNQADHSTRSFCFPAGLSDCIVQKNPDSTVPVFQNSVAAFGQDRYNRPKYQAHLEIAIAFSPDGGSEACIHNFRQLSWGGLHIDSVRERICRAVNNCFYTEIESASRDLQAADISYEELHDHIHMVVATFCCANATQWENGSRQSIANQMIADMAFDAVSGPFFDYVRAHRDALAPMVEKILRKRDAR